MTSIAIRIIRQVWNDKRSLMLIVVALTVVQFKFVEKKVNY